MLIENSFDVDADPDRVFTFLQNPHNVAACFPGAELTEDLGDDRYKGKVKIKLGPVTAAFTGVATITERDEAARLAVLVAEGKDARGSGTAKATATMRVEPKEDGGSSVRLHTDLTISGRLAQFGRGIMADVSTRMVNDLATRVRERIESTPAEEPQAAAEEPTTATEAAPDEAAPAAGAAAPTDTAQPAESEPAPAATTAEAEAGDAETGSAEAAASGADSGAVSGATTDTATEPAAGATVQAAESAATQPAPGEAATEQATQPAADTTPTTAAAAETTPAASPASAAPAKAPATSDEPAGAIKATTLLKVVVVGMFRRLFARLRGRSDNG